MKRDGKRVSKRGNGKGRDMTKPRFTSETIEGAIRDCLGSVAKAAKKLKCDRTLIYLYMRRDATIKTALDKARDSYKDDCQEYARDNHLTRLMAGEPGSTAYELARMEPKPPGQHLDLGKLTSEEVVLLKHLLDKARPDGDPQPRL